MEKKHRYLTFDCYGTLIDWRTGIEAGLKSALGGLRLQGSRLLASYVEREAAEESTYRKYREIMQRAAASLSAALGVEVSARAARNFAASLPAWPAFPDSARFLRRMGSLGYVRYILSNVDEDMLEETIARNRFEVDGFVTAEEVGSYKPRPEHWRRFLEKTHAGKESVLHVAQSVYHDILPTQQMGIDSAWVNRYNEPLPTGAAPLFVVEDLASLGDLLAVNPP